MLRDVTSNWLIIAVLAEELSTTYFNFGTAHRELIHALGRFFFAYRTLCWQCYLCTYFTDLSFFLNWLDLEEFLLHSLKSLNILKLLTNLVCDLHYAILVEFVIIYFYLAWFLCDCWFSSSISIIFSFVWGNQFYWILIVNLWLYHRILYRLRDFWSNCSAIIVSCFLRGLTIFEFGYARIKLLNKQQ